MTTETLPLKLSTCCGSLLSIILTIDGGDLVKSVVLATTGTIVSYALSRVLKALFEK